MLGIVIPRDVASSEAEALAAPSSWSIIRVWVVFIVIEESWRIAV
jgi:hypothetical protein